MLIAWGQISHQLTGHFDVNSELCKTILIVRFIAANDERRRTVPCLISTFVGFPTFCVSHSTFEFSSVLTPIFLVVVEMYMVLE